MNIIERYKAKKLYKMFFRQAEIAIESPFKIIEDDDKRLHRPDSTSGLIIHGSNCTLYFDGQPVGTLQPISIEAGTAQTYARSMLDLNEEEVTTW